MSEQIQRRSTNIGMCITAESKDARKRRYRRPNYKMWFAVAGTLVLILAIAAFVIHARA